MHIFIVQTSSGHSVPMSQACTNPRAFSSASVQPWDAVKHPHSTRAHYVMLHRGKIDRAVYLTFRNSCGIGYAGRKTARHGAIGAIAVGLSPAA